MHCQDAVLGVGFCLHSVPLVKAFVGLRDMSGGVAPSLTSQAVCGMCVGCVVQVEELEKEIFRLAGTEFSVASPKQLANVSTSMSSHSATHLTALCLSARHRILTGVVQVLFERLGLPAKKRGKKSDWSTGADVLEELAKDGHAIAQHIIEWRSKSKLKSTYADPLVKQVALARGICFHVALRRCRVLLRLRKPDAGVGSPAITPSFVCGCLTSRAVR